MLTAIETLYAGCRFRSRLEARWAVFFDALGIAWEYEPEGYEITDGHTSPIRYLPDFYLPDPEVWVEVKGQWDWPELRKCCIASFDHRGGLPLAPGDEMPDDQSRNRMRMLCLGGIPRPLQHRRPMHLALHFNKGYVYGAPFVWHPMTMIDAWEVWETNLVLHDDEGNAEYFEHVEKRRYRSAALEFANSEHYRPAGDDLINRAYVDARSARFEHGEAEKW